MSDIAVVGSGAAGLAAAYRLREAGHNVRILERNARLGGKMLTTRKLGFTLEEGPSAMAGSYHSILGIAREAGMGADLVPASGRIALPGPEREMHYLDPTRIVKDGYRTSLISTRAKIRLARLGIDLFRTRSRRKPYDLSLLEEFDGVSAEQYSRSRLGDELTDYLVDPCIRSFVNCGSSEVSAADLLYVFGAFMGSSEYVAFRHGMSSYAERIGALCEVTLEAEVCAVRDRGTVVEVTWRGIRRRCGGVRCQYGGFGLCGPRPVEKGTAHRRRGLHLEHGGTCRSPGGASGRFLLHFSAREQVPELDDSLLGAQQDTYAGSSG
jgi:protoporphyrinogen/coproporphyrinogen III oxidase